MTKSLVIDTSTSRTSVAIVDGKKSLAHFYHDDALAHGEILPRLVRDAITICNDIDRVVIGMGPGPFTGLRVGIAFAQSFALARNIPWVGVCSLDAIASGVTSPDFLVATDARRKELFWARYQNGQRITEPQVSAPRTLAMLALPAFGEGAIKYKFATEPEPALPDAIAMAALADSTSATYTSPIYIRRPDAFPAPVGVTFRVMTAVDLISVYDLEKKSYKYDAWSMGQLKAELSGKNRWYIVAEVEGDVVGYAGGLFIDEIADVLTLTVDPDFRRQGIGRELLRRLIDWSRTKKATAVMLEVRIGNEEAQPLYLSFGFVEISRRAHYYGPGLTAIIMRKDLM